MEITGSEIGKTITYALLLWAALTFVWVMGVRRGRRDAVRRLDRPRIEALDAVATAQRIARNALAENRVLRERIARGTASFHAPLARPVNHCAECDPIFPCFKEGNCIREGAGA